MSDVFEYCTLIAYREAQGEGCYQLRKEKKNDPNLVPKNRSRFFFAPNLDHVSPRVLRYNVEDYRSYRAVKPFHTSLPLRGRRRMNIPSASAFKAGRQWVTRCGWQSQRRNRRHQPRFLKPPRVLETKRNGSSRRLYWHLMCSWSNPHICIFKATTTVAVTYHGKQKAKTKARGYSHFKCLCSLVDGQARQRKASLNAMSFFIITCSSSVPAGPA